MEPLYSVEFTKEELEVAIGGLMYAYSVISPEKNDDPMQLMTLGIIMKLNAQLPEPASEQLIVDTIEMGRLIIQLKNSL